MRLKHSQLQLDKFSEHELTFIFHIDEKLFTVALLRTQKWSGIRVSGNQTARHHYRSCFAHASNFSKSVCISVSGSKFGYTNLIFTKPCTKINTHYYREVFQMQELLPVICSIVKDVFVLWQGNAIMSWLRLLCLETRVR